MTKLTLISIFLTLGGTEKHTAREAAKPKRARNWGWCTEWCGQGQMAARKIKVIIHIMLLFSLF